MESPDARVERLAQRVIVPREVHDAVLKVEMLQNQAHVLELQMPKRE